MSGAAPNYAEIARRMLEHAEGGVGTPSAELAAVGAVQEQLLQRLAPLIGVGGVRALLARSVKRTCAEFPELVHLQALGLLNAANFGQDLVEALQRDSPSATRDAVGSLFTNFLSLTGSLIGERLVLMVVQRAFPSLDVAAKQEPDK